MAAIFNKVEGFTERHKINAPHNLGCDPEDSRRYKTQCVRIYRQQAERYLSATLLNISFTEYENHKEKYEIKAAQYYRMAAEEGDAESQFSLGEFLEKGRSIPKDEKQAIEWYIKAAEQGNERAQVKLGLMLAAGNKVTNDESKAIRWLRSAVRRGHSEAQPLYEKMLPGIIKLKDEQNKATTTLNSMTYPSPSLILASDSSPAISTLQQINAKDEKKSQEFGQKSAAQRCALTMFNVLKSKSSKTPGAADDAIEALEEICKAVERRDKVDEQRNAQYKLGMLYIFGNVVRDVKVGLEWLRLADKQGHSKAHKYLQDFVLSTKGGYSFGVDRQAC